jgi:hypothetical protein
MNTAARSLKSETRWSELSQQLGLNDKSAIVSDESLRAAGFEEVIDILDDGELVYTRLTSQPETRTAI